MPFPDRLVQEFRNLVSVLCRETCMMDKASGESVGGQQTMQEKVFHGSTGYASLLTVCLSGKGNTESLYNRLPIENNREGNADRREPYMLQMRDVFTCDEVSCWLAVTFRKRMPSKADDATLLAFSGTKSTVRNGIHCWRARVYP
jgi:hypothetical protein